MSIVSKYFFLQNSVTNHLSLRMCSIKYLTIGENKIESINIFVTRLSVDNFISFSMKLEISTFRVPGHHYEHIIMFFMLRTLKLVTP